MRLRCLLGFCLWLSLSLATPVPPTWTLAQTPRPQSPSGQALPRRAELDYQPPSVSTPRLHPLGAPASTAASPPGLNPLAPSSPGHETPPAMSVPGERGAPSSSADVPPEGRDEGPITATELKLLISPGHLNDVAFVDRQVGVAVGNQGLIWRTTDGGRRWSPIRCDWNGDLQSIAFADSQNGWIVGGRALPIRGLHEGVVLRTQDGGVTWRRLASAILPSLNSVAYDHQQRKLWVVGEADGQFSSGIFESYDLGQNWSDVPAKFAAAGSRPVGSGSTSATAGLEPAVDGTAASNVAFGWNDQWIISNPLGTFRVQTGRTTLSRWEPLPGELDTPRLNQIVALGSRIMGIGQDGRMYQSRNQGEKWEWAGGPANALGPSQVAAPHLAVMAAAGDSLWAAPRVGRQLWHFDGRTQTWQTQEFPGTFQCNALYFADPQVGWAVGSQGNVLGTSDGGRTWQWLHRAHPRLAVLVLAANSRDLPPELLAHLAANQGLNIGVLLGAAHLPATVIQQAYSQQEVATTLFDPVAFDPGQPPGILQPRIQQYLDAFQPSILLVCPPAAGQPAAATHSRQVPVNQWLEAIQSRAAQGRTPGVAMIATLTSEGAETSTSSAALATQVGQLLGDLAWPSNQVLQAWEPPTSGLAGSSREPRRGTAPTDSRVIGVRRLISIEDTQLTWFNARSAPNDPRVAGLSMRPVRSRTSATNIDAISRMTNKVNWLHQMARVETRSPQARAQWQRGLTLSLSYLPESMHAIWLAELAEQCEAAGDPRKATLARWEALHAFLDSPAGLVALLPTVQWLISDEAQWENRSEAQAVRREKFAELQRLFAQEAAEGPLSDEDRKARALRRFGIEPHLESKVPPEIVERILLLDQVQRQAARDGQIQPTAEVRQAAALPQSRVLTEQDSRQYQNQAGQLQRLSTVLTWDTPLLPDPGGGSSAAAPPAGEPSSLTIVDLPDNQRLELANRLISRADSLWPALNGLPQWWLLKAQVKQQSQDIVQTDLAWNRLALMAADPRVAALHPADLPPASKIAQHKRVALARAEAGDRVDLRSLSQRPVSHFSTQTGGMSPPEEVSVPLLPVTWTLERPFLDGRCDEELWSHDASNSVLRLAQDEQYLYVAIQSPGLETAGPRSADRAPKSMTSDAVPAGERDQADRQNGLSLRIDTDGDGRDSFVIHFDTQGQVADLQGRFEHWNPKLFVAQTVTPTQWTIEMAIDLEDLSLERLGQPWQIQLQQAPSDSAPPLVQAWTQLAHPLH